MSSVQPVLIFGYGNPGRGDDALGPEVVAAIEAENHSDARYPLVETQSDMQLQVEHVMDLAGRERVLFVDADMACTEPYTFNTLEPEKDGSYTSHAMTPGALLHAYKKVYGTDAPPAYMLRIRGYDFELGDPMGEPATTNLTSAMELVKKLCTNSSEEYWVQHFTNTGSQGTQEPSCRLPGCGGYTLPTNIERSD